MLYLNTVDPKYYCRAVEAITFTYSSDENHNEELKSQLAIVQYLMESKKCPMDSALLVQAYEMGMELWRERWADTMTVDTNLVKMDTTLPTLEDLDLEILRGPEFASINSDPALQSLLGVRVVNNPFSTSTEIEYTLGRAAQMELAIYNALGQSVWTKPFGIQLYYSGRGYAQTAGYRKQGYDTLKYFVEKCAPDTSFRGAYDAFTDMNGAVQFMGG